MSNENFKRQGIVLSEQHFNQLADESSNDKVIDEAIASLKRKGNFKIVQFIEADSK